MKKFRKITAFLMAGFLLMNTAFSYAQSTETTQKIERRQFSYRSNILATSDMPRWDAYDVVVFGSDPEGIAAAYSAGKEKLRVLLVDFNRDRVGGLYTLGWLNMIDFNHAPGEAQWYTNRYQDNFLNHGVFERFYNMIGNRKAFDIGDAQAAFEKLLVEANVEVMLTTDDKMSYKYISADKKSEIVLNGATEPTKITAKVVIDATPNGDIALMAGAKFLEGKEDLGLKGQYQSATLVYKLKGLNWDVISNTLKYDGDLDTGASGDAAWGYDFLRTAPVNHPHMQTRGLNLGRQKDGTVLINAFQIFEFKPYDKMYQIQIRDEAIKRIKEDIIPYMRANINGFQKAEFVSAAPEFYIRETRHLIGEQTLTANDVFDSVFPSNYIAVGSYPIDIQAKQKGDKGTILSGTKPYGLAAGTIMPKGIDGIYVVSKVASFDSVAFGSARTVPVLMALGEAAGAMASVVIKNDATTRSILGNYSYLYAVRQLMYDRGVRLVQYTNQHPINDSYAEKEIRFLRSKALVSMTYRNDYALKSPATVERLELMLHLIENNSPYHVQKYHALGLIDKPMSHEIMLSELLPVMNYFVKKNYTNFEDFKKYKLIPQEVYDHIMAKEIEYRPPGAKEMVKDVPLLNEDVYAIFGNLIPKTPLRTDK